MNRRGRLLARGIRWRLGASLLTVLAATIAVAAAVLGPLYLHAAGDSVVRRTLADAPVPETGLTLPLYSKVANGYAVVQQAVRDVSRIDGRHHFYGTPIVSAIDQGGSANPAGADFTYAVIARTDICGHVHVISGRCDLSAGSSIVSARSARKLGLKVGSRLTTVAGSPYDGQKSVTRTVTVTGVYAIPDVAATYWWGAGSGEFPYGKPSSPKGPPQLDPLFVSPATVLSFGGAAAVAQIPLQTDGVGLAQENQLRGVQAQAITAAHHLGILPTSSLNSVLGDADHQRHQLATIVALAAVQLVLLAIWVLTSLLVRSAEARQAEARAARLRGFPTSSLLWATAAEPGLLCLVGAVLGVGVAWAAVVVARSSLLARGSTITFDLWVVIALVITVLAIVGALGIGALRLLRSTQLSQGELTRRRGVSVGYLVDVTLVVLAIAALVTLATTGALSGHTSPLAAAAPGLIALGTAVVAVQVILLACRLGVARSGDSPRIAIFLALRQTARRPGLLRQARVLVIALGLACFATAAWSVARSNRASAADFQVGARTVVSVAPRSPTVLAQQVRDLDPHGRYAMAAVDIQRSSSSLLAVDTSRLSAVASWPDGISSKRLPAVMRLLAPHTAPQVTLPRARLRVSALVSATGAARRRLGDVDLDLWVTNPVTGTNIIQLGALHPGGGTYTAADDITGLGTACPGGCRLEGVGVAPPSGYRPATSGTVRVTLTGLTSGTGRPVAADFAAGDWRSSADTPSGAQGGVAVTIADRSLTLTVPAAAIDADESASGGVTPPMAAVADHPATLPAVATQELEAANASVATGVLPTSGLDGASINVRPVATVTGLPRLGTNAAMVDLALLSRVQVNPANVSAVDQVWLGARTPHDVLARLRAHGLTPLTVQRASTVLAAMQRTGPALADDFLLVAAIAALLVAAASTLSALGATTRERATELSSLRVAGVPRRTLSRALSLESLILLVTALCGAGAGILAAALALPSLPERAAPSLVPLRYALPFGTVGIVTVAVLAAVALAAFGIAIVLMRRISPSLLRTAPDDISA